ncbi:conjugal transfer protein TraF [Vibrio cholerae]|uniref:conjugal transfer protein TraF n=1 Tax=Vibrio fluvialis TaxID=676 RepID=UPI002572669B|nr:conjugal transfer protein TraF [Vibrio fluvialis]
MKLKLMTLMLLSTSTLAAANTADTSAQKPKIDPFFTDGEKGWFWYEQLPEEEKEKFVEKLLKEQPTLIPTQPAKPASPQPAEDKPLSTAWFRENFQKYQDAAMDNPYNQEAMRTYLYLEKFMRDRAVAFGYERQKTVYSDPFLDSTSARPTANFGLRSMNRRASEIREDLLAEVGKQSGLFFFYRSDDEFSQQQAPLIKALEKDYGFAIKPISMDGKPLGKEGWTDYLTDNGQAATLGVYQVPAIYVFNPNNERFEVVAQGLQSLTELKRRTIAAAERAEIITPEQAQLMRGSGLYQTTEGDISNGFPLPDHAPDLFKQMYFESIKQELQ